MSIITTPVPAEVPTAEQSVETSDVLNAAVAAIEAAQNPVSETLLEAPPVEAKPEQVEEKPKEEVPKQDDKFAAKFAALSRKEKEVRQREQRLNSQMKAMEDRIKKMEEREAQFNSFDEQLKADPLSVLEKKGLSYKDLTERYVLKPEDTPEQKQNSTIEELRGEIKALHARWEQQDTEKKKSAEEAQQQRVESARQELLTSVTSHVNESGEKYELVKQNDAVSVVYEVMEEAFQQRLKEDPELVLTPDELNVLRDEALEAVESHLLEEAKKLIESNKLKNILGALAPKAEPKKEPETKASVTLSNNLSQQVPSTKSEKYLSDEESKKLMATLIRYKT